MYDPKAMVSSLKERTYSIPNMSAGSRSRIYANI